MAEDKRKVPAQRKRARQKRVAGVLSAIGWRRHGKVPRDKPPMPRDGNGK